MQREEGMEEEMREALPGMGDVFLLIKLGSSWDTGAGAYVFLGHHVVVGRAGTEECAAGLVSALLVLAFILTALPSVTGAAVQLHLMKLRTWKALFSLCLKSCSPRLLPQIVVKRESRAVGVLCPNCVPERKNVAHFQASWARELEILFACNRSPCHRAVEIILSVPAFGVFSSLQR